MARTKDYAEVIRAKLRADPALAQQVEAESFNADIARKVYEARTAAGLTQKQLAEHVGTQQSVISRIEDADYSGHSLALLKKIAGALGLKLRVEFCTGSVPEVQRYVGGEVIWDASVFVGVFSTRILAEPERYGGSSSSPPRVTRQEVTETVP